MPYSEGPVLVMLCHRARVLERRHGDAAVEVEVKVTPMFADRSDRAIPATSREEPSICTSVGIGQAQNIQGGAERWSGRSSGAGAVLGLSDKIGLLEIIRVGLAQ